MPETQIYIASSADAGDKAVYAGTFDNETGDIHIKHEVDTFPNGHYLNLHPDGRFLYVSGASPASAFVFSIDETSGELSALNSQPTLGNSPCYVAPDASGRYVLTVNYTGENDQGSIILFPLDEHNYLHPYTDRLQLDGSSINKDRQQSSHPHMISPAFDGNFVLVPDLGTDRVMIYTIDSTSGKFIPHDPPYIDIEPGAGPRHFDYHEDHQTLYVINELDSTLSVFKINEGFQPEQIQHLSTLPPGVTDSYCADIHVHPNGRFLYGSNRGHNSITIYGINDDGTVTLIGHESTRGNWPRNFCIDPSGEWLLVANRRSNDIQVFSIDTTTGKLEFSGKSLELPDPVCIKMR